MKALIFATGNLMGIARFPKALKQAGFQVGVLCPAGSFVSRTRYVDEKWFLKTTKPGINLFNSLVKDLVKAIESFSPQLLIAGDERAVYCLHRIVRLAAAGQLGSIPQSVLEVIEFSLCNPKFYEATNNKNITQEIARRLGIRVPVQYAVESAAEALDAANQLTYPVVLKKGTGEAGLGVRICQNEQQILEFLQLPLFRKPGRIKQMVRRVLDREASWMPNNAAIAVQQFVTGTPAMYCAAAVEGRFLAGFAALKECIYPHPTGQATRIRFIEQPEMTAAVSTFIAEISYTGFIDFDFMIEAETALPYFLECNPRPTAVFHLGETIGVNLCQAMQAALSNQTYTPAPQFDSNQIIALFPQEWLRDSQSPYLAGSFHNVPWDDPELLQAYVCSSH